MSGKINRLLSTITAAAMTCAIAMPAYSVLAEERSGVTEIPIVNMAPSKAPVTATWNITAEPDASALVQSFLGGGITVVGTPTLTGTAGLFINTSDAIGFESGIILSTGNIFGVPGPNSTSAYTLDNGLSGDPALTALIPGYTTYDATVLEFDFELPPTIGISSFQYVFASEEYNEWVGSEFNDVFGFFLDGDNIALIPSTATPVSINNVNNGSYPGYYIDNTGNVLDTQMDGLTTVLTAKVNVLPGEPHHIKLAIADAGDHILDSNVFLKAESFTINLPPVVLVDAPSVSVDEGALAVNSGTWSDENGDAVTLSASIGTIIANGDGTWSWSYLTTDGIVPDTQEVFISADDGQGGTGAASFDLYVANIAPTLSEIPVSANVIPVGAEFSAEAAFTDPSPVDTHTALWSWGDGSSSVGIVDATTRIAKGSHIYTSPGIYTIGLEVTDDDGGVAFAEYQYIVVYDPSAGFVTGGGWIDSPYGAYTEDPALTGKASFGFVSKYQKGAKIPTGTTEFQFHAAGLNFHSTSYDWLVVAGSKAQFKGTGTINGEGDYGFMLSAVDGTPDRFRIKIWDKATDLVIYDNQMGGSDDAVPTTAISSGSIVIHKAK